MRIRLLQSELPNWIPCQDDDSCVSFVHMAVDEDNNNNHAVGVNYTASDNQMESEDYDPNSNAEMKATRERREESHKYIKKGEASQNVCGVKQQQMG